MRIWQIGCLISLGELRKMNNKPNGLLNGDGEKGSYTDGECKIYFSKVHGFVLMSNLEGLSFGDSSAHSDLMLIKRNKDFDYTAMIIEMKYINSKDRKEGENLMETIINKFHSTKVTLLPKSKKPINLLEGKFTTLLKDYNKPPKFVFIAVLNESTQSHLYNILLKLQQKLSKELGGNFVMRNCGEEII